MADAIAREKQIKSWTRAKKEKLIATLNPERKDISQQFESGQPTPENMRKKIAAMESAMTAPRPSPGGKRME